MSPNSGKPKQIKWIQMDFCSMMFNDLLWCLHVYIKLRDLFSLPQCSSTMVCFVCRLVAHCLRNPEWMGLVFGEMSIIEMPINRASLPTDVIQVMLFFSKTYLPPFCFGKNLFSLVFGGKCIGSCSNFSRLKDTFFFHPTPFFPA